MNSKTGSAEDYLAEVRKQLADLPPEEVTDILADITPQILEAATDSDRPLTERLGMPRRYAEELRAAAGLPARPSSGTGTARFALWSLTVGSVAAVGAGFLNMWVMRVSPRTFGGAVRLPLILALLLLLAGALTAIRLGPSIRSVMALPEVRRVCAVVSRIPVGVRAYIHSVQPGWWLARGVLIAAPALLAHQPSILWVVALFTLAGVGVWTGPRGRTDRRWLWISVPTTGFALGTLLLMVDVFWVNPVMMTGDGTFHFVDRLLLTA
ncbi:HAAS signaling domain-containing protein [Kibdelosporangium phytohabitans]|uniref:DUF1700 domain-containing protein n=1 Tax=Kibdelosporangium phytohabitans TaxID=860235 RepID=A0A0N9HLC9_9PSEU|nr:hypothetical protein [Kibdelosporangium phytohabitans]ALG06965.1 hypothetical protein AOZ06_08535 [Kibdelosporangium phytohabitans]MBE1468246.1 hypothetical protein [Kibdelosporangium phytohabitans]